jgi:hypothetical protein
MFSAGLLINPNMPRLQFSRHHLAVIPLADTKAERARPASKASAFEDPSQAGC